MQIILTATESEDYFHTALCNGLSPLSYGLELTYEDEEYQTARAKLLKNGKPCFEDVLLQILKDGGSLTIVDHEGDYTRRITMVEVHERVAKIPINHLYSMINESDDATTADVILQTVFFNGIIFG